MSPRSADLAAKPYGKIYRVLRGRWRAAEPAAAGSGGGELAEFCRRLGAFPKSWSARRAQEAVDGVIDRMAAATGAAPDEVRADLLGFCSGENPDALCGSVPLCAECPVRQYCDYPGRRVTIKDLPETERPRERLIEAGEERLSDVELLAIIIGGGSQKETALDLARRLVSAFGTFRRMARCAVGELTRVHGIGPAKAARIKAALAIARRYASEKLPAGTVIAGSEQVSRYMREKLAGLKKEHFYSLMLDIKNRLIREERVAVGSLSENVVHPREVFRTAIAESAARVIFVHNHPSGNPEPSPQDRRLTARLCEVGDLVGIQVIDHVIVGQSEYFSFAEKGLLGQARP